MTPIRRSLLITLIVIGGGAAGVVIGAVVTLSRDLPQIQALENFKPSAVSRIFSADKALLAELYAEKRDPVPLDDIPDDLKAAIIATEDRNFHRHNGIDLKGILRAVIKDIWAGEFVEGASTITQQLAKTLFLGSQKTLTRKLKEAVLALQLERRYTKQEILAFYLNQVYFGSGAYGVESAARIFFGKSVRELTLAECALIAGMPKAPSRYSPLVDKTLAVQRRNLVLKQMQLTGIITEARYRSAVKQPLDLIGGRGKRVKAPYFIEYVKTLLESVVDSSRLYREGLVVVTTLNSGLQQAAEQAVANGLSALAKRMERNGIKNPMPQAALVALDVQSGAILAMVGGSDFHTSAFNRAVDARRQPGSAFKPIAFALAIERGFAQNAILPDAPVAFRGAKQGEEWRPENFSNTFTGEMTLRHALAASQNIPAVRLIEMLGPASVAEFAHRMGIGSPLAPNLPLVLGASGVTLLELTAAYAVFPSGGYWAEPFGAVEIMDRSGRMLWRNRPKKKVVMSRAGAAIMTNLLQAVVQEGTGRQARGLDRPVAGKTGTTDRFRDALFIGFSPAIAVGVWVGRDDNTSLGKGETGAQAALPIWMEFMKTALVKAPVRYFDIPDDVTPVHMDPVTGKSVPDEAPRSVVALFRKGTEP